MKINLKALNINQAIFGLVILIITYTYWIHARTLNIDGESLNTFKQTMGLGRWFHSFLRLYILPEPFVFVLTPLIALFFILISSLILCQSLEIKGIKAYAAIAIYTTFPQLAYQLEFLNQADTFAIGVFLCTLSVVFLSKKKGLLYYLTAISLMILSYAIYQTLITYVAVGVIGLNLQSSIKNEKQNKEITLNILTSFFAILFSFILYALITKYIKYQFDIASTNYFANYTLSDGGFLEIIQNTIISYYNYVFKSPLFGMEFYGYLSVLLVPFVIRVVLFKNLKVAYELLLSIILFITPMVFLIFSGPVAPPRLFVASSLALTLLAVTSLNFTKINKIIYTIIGIAIAYNIMKINILFHDDHLARARDIILAKEIETVAASKGINLKGKYVYLHGSNNEGNQDKPSEDIFGKSFFSWDGGNYRRMIYFMNHYKVCNCVPATQSQIKTNMSRIVAMPSWPDHDSIYQDGNVVIIKLSPQIGWLPFSLD